MNTSIPSEAQEQKNKLEGGTWFYRVDFVFADTTEVNFCNDKQQFTYGGKTYLRIPFELSPLTKSTDGALPTRTMSVAGEAVDSWLKPYIRAKGGVANAVVTITKVLYEEPALDMSSDSEIYIASHHTKSDQAITVHLGYTRMRDQQIPLETYNYLRCRVYSNFKGTACGYAGAGTTCDGTFAQCRAYSNEARWNAESGLRPKTAKLA